MNKSQLYLTAAGATLALTTACSTAPSPEAAPSSTILAPASPESMPTLSAEREKYLSGLALQLEQDFEASIKSGKPVNIKQVVGTCAVIAFTQPSTGDKVAVVAANPTALSTYDQTTGETLSISAVYNPLSRSFVYGQPLVAYGDESNPSSATLAGPTEELDMFPPDVTQEIVDITLTWSDKTQSPVNQDGKELMNIVSIGVLDTTIEDYASGDLARLACLAGITGAQPSSSSVSA